MSMRKKYFARGSNPVTRALIGGNMRLLTESETIRHGPAEINMGDEINKRFLVRGVNSVRPNGVNMFMGDCLAFSQTKLSV